MANVVLAVLKTFFVFCLAPPSPGGSRGRVRTVIFPGKSVFVFADSGTDPGVYYISILISALSAARIRLSSRKAVVPNLDGQRSVRPDMPSTRPFVDFDCADPLKRCMCPEA